MNNKTFSISYVIIFFLISFLFVATCDAAILSIDSVNTNVEIGKKFPVDIYLDTEGETINSLEMNIDFPVDKFVFGGYDSENNIIPFWVNPPKENSSRNIFLSGVIPGGIDRVYDSENPNRKSIKIIRLFFSAKEIGSASISFQDASLLKNDGFGTSVFVKTQAKVFNIIKNSDNPDSQILDTNPPLPFIVSIVENSVFGKTPKLAIFEAKDEEGGIKYYEAKINSGDFHEAVSPYPLPYKLFSYTLSVRAYDFSGNFKEQQITVRGDKPYGLLTLVLTIGIFVVLYKYIPRKKL